MSTTRHASPDAPVAQERYMSSPEYSDQRGLSGAAVAAKASQYSDARVRSLLFFIQALSLRPGGLAENVTARLLAMYPERVGTPSMHRFGMEAGTIYSADQARTVRAEVEGPATLREWRQARREASAAAAAAAVKNRAKRREDALARASQMTEAERNEAAALALLRRGVDGQPQAEALPANEPVATPTPVAEFIAACRARLSGCLEQFLQELCINPHWKIVMPGQAQSSAPDTQPELWHFHDIIGALLEFQARHAKAAQEAFVSTSISTRIHRTLERGRRSRRFVVCNGVEGVGKSFSGEAWCEQHLGEARFVRLRGNQTEATFYSAVWVALGLGSPVNRKVQELRSRVDRFLEQTAMMLVIDEGHRLLPQSERIYTQPALMNWIYGLWDIQCPCALLVTPQFVSRLDAVERQTDWRSGQFKRRISSWTDLPERLTEADLRAVAPALARARSRTKLVLSGPMLDELVDFAFPARRQLDAMARAVEEAEFIAEESGRATPNLRDLVAAMSLAQETERAMTTRLDRERQTKGAGDGARQRRGRATAAALQPSCDAPDEVMPDATGDRRGEDLDGTEYPLREVTPRHSVTVPA